MADERVKSGQCLCGAVKLSASGPFREVIACHCKQCRRWTGYYWGATSVYCDNLSIDEGEEQIAWYQSSDVARRAFCRCCGSSLFYHRSDQAEDAEHTISISPGLFDDPSGFRHGSQIHCEDAGDYYDLPDYGAPRGFAPE
ncbi:GFA family protein [Coralliovum pocilloporae]|uniref:GFA family protein n=1 Tax=Coralliovum pocilloporae TaxID=3066369 RepID=UPI0033077D58